MTIFEKLKNKNIDELANWLDEYATHDTSPWYHWWDSHYCNKCEGVEKDGMKFAYCELHGNCKFFKDMEEIPDNKQIIKMWLENQES